MLHQLLIASLFMFPALVQASPTLTPTARVVAPVNYRADSKSIRDPKGELLFIQMHESPESTQLLDIVALNSNGQVAFKTNLFRPYDDAYISIDDASFDAQGALRVVMQARENNGGSQGLQSINLVTGNSVRLLESGRWPRFEGRLRVNNKNLALVTSDLGDGVGKTPTVLLRVLDEDSGEVLQQKILDFHVSVKLGVDRRGLLKVLLMGYDQFGLLDVATNSVEELLPRRVLPAIYPQEIELSIGKFLAMTQNDRTDLLDINEVWNAKVKVVRSFSAATEFLTLNDGQPASLTVDRTTAGLVIRDLKTGKQIGMTIPKTGVNRSRPSVQALLQTEKGPIAVIWEPKHPQLYVQGSITTYLNLKTGKTLRVAVEESTTVWPQLKVLPDGRLVAIESDRLNIDSAPLRVVDLATNQILSEVTDHLAGAVFSSKSAPLLGVSVKRGEACVINLLLPTDRTCLQDPLLSENTQYGYQPFESREGELILPLLTIVNRSWAEAGYLRLRVD